MTLVFALTLSMLAVILLQGIGPFPTLSEDEHTRYLVLALTGIVLVRLDRLEGRINAVDQGNAAQGTRQQGRDSSRSEGREEGSKAGSLPGHWHRHVGTFPNDYPAYFARDCAFTGPNSDPRACPRRDPRSTD